MAAKKHRNSSSIQEDGGGDDLAQVNSVPDTTYLTGLRLFVVILSVTVVLFLMMLDISILSTAIPQITSDFHRLEDVGWYVGAYLLASATIQPLTGKMYTHFNTKWTFLIFLFIFEAGSAVCASATSSRNLIGGRTVAGIGGSGLLNGGLTIIMGACSEEIRPMATGLAMGVSQIGIILGPLLGGVFTEQVSWRWCFYINLPLGGLAAAVVVFTNVPDHVVKPPLTLPLLRSLLPRFDLVGFALFAPASVMLLLALQFGSGSEYEWSDPVVIGLFAGGGVAAVVFAAWEYRAGEDAMIPGPVVGNPIILCSILYFGFLLTSVSVGSNFLPIYLQSVRGLSPIMSGVYLLGSIISQLIFVLVSAGLVTRLGYYLPWAAFAACTTAVGAGLISTWGTHETLAVLIGYQVVFGGRGAGMQMSVIAVQHELPAKYGAIGNSLLVFCQNVFGAVFITVANTLFQETLRKEIRENAPGVSPEAAVAAGGSADAVRKLAASGHDREAVLAAYASGVSSVLYLLAAVATVAFFCSLGMGWVDIREKKDGGEAGKGRNDDEEKATGDEGDRTPEKEEV